MGMERWWASSKKDAAEVPSSPGSSVNEQPLTYRMYKRRWIGLIAVFILNIISGLALVWFGPIATEVVNEFGFTLNQVNWLGNVTNLIFLPASAIAPVLYGKLGIRGTCLVGGGLFVTSAWIRYAGTATSVSIQGSYALIMVGQIIAGLATPVFQVLVPSYSEKWFNLKERTTATMIMGVGNPLGSGLGQLISPLVGNTRQSLLVMAIIYTATAPLVLLVGNAPPTPPTFAGSQDHPSLISLGRAMAGKEDPDKTTYMTKRERLDFALATFIFGVLVGTVNSFNVLTNGQLGPYGYSSDDAGFLGATLLFVGLACAFITSPLFDRVFTHHLMLAIRILCPIMGACWFALIWEIKPNNVAVLYVLMALIGGIALTLLPIVLELAVELTRNADGSAASLWFSANLFAFIFVLVETALRAGPEADPPLNQRRGIIFQGVVVFATCFLVYFVRGKQARRERDEQMRDTAAQVREAEKQDVQVQEVVATDAAEELSIRERPHSAASRRGGTPAGA